MASGPKKFARPAIMMEQPDFTPTKVETFSSQGEAFSSPVDETPAPVSFAAETVEAVEAVEAPQAVAKDAGEKVRAIVEKGLVETRAKFAQAKSAAEEATAAVEASLGAAREGVVAFNVKALDSVKSAAEAQFDFFKSLASAKSMSEMVTLHTEFARSRFEEASTHSKELAELARKVADETVAPIKAHVAKTFKVAV